LVVGMIVPALYNINTSDDDYACFVLY